MNDELKDIYNDAYSKGLEAGRREVLEEVHNILADWYDEELKKNEKNAKINYSRVCLLLKNKVEDLTSDPQTPQKNIKSGASVLANKNEYSFELSSPKSCETVTEESSSEGCILCNGDGTYTDFNGEGYIRTRPCPRCKQKQEKKE